MNTTPEATKRDVAYADAVKAYFEDTWHDYRLIWMNSDNRAMHLGFWDRSTRSHRESLTNMNWALAARAQLSPGDHVLDAGCGVGGTAMWLAETFPVSVVGITLVAGQVARATRYARRRGLDDRVEFAQQDYMHMQLPDSSFDVVWANDSFCHSPDERGFLAEAFRVLKRNGRLVVGDFFRAQRPLSREEEEVLLSNWLSCWAIRDLVTMEELSTWAGEVGFEDTRVQDVTRHVERSSRRLWRMAKYMYPMHSVLRAFGIRSKSLRNDNSDSPHPVRAGFRTLFLRSNLQHLNERGARDQWRCLKRGLWKYGIFSATKRLTR